MDVYYLFTVTSIFKDWMELYFCGQGYAKIRDNQIYNGITVLIFMTGACVCEIFLISTPKRSL